LRGLDLVREVPEAIKPRSIPIASSSKLLKVKPTKVAACRPIEFCERPGFRGAFVLVGRDEQRLISPATRRPRRSSRVPGKVKSTDISTILIIGAEPIIIGQACEFDYSGTQACKALREEGY
jgi:hypothetical protein